MFKKNHPGKDLPSAKICLRQNFASGEDLGKAQGFASGEARIEARIKARMTCGRSPHHKLCGFFCCILSKKFIYRTNNNPI
jgi:hypothetical protein